MTPRWTAPADIAARVRRRWDDGSLLRFYAANYGLPGGDTAGGDAAGKPGVSSEARLSSEPHVYGTSGISGSSIAPGSPEASGLPDELFPFSIPLRGPKASEIGSDLGAARDWVTALDAGRVDNRHYRLEWSPIGGRAIGRNEIPTRALVDTFDQACALLGVQRQVRLFDEILARVIPFDAVKRWVIAHPLRAITRYDAIPALIEAYCWLESHRGSGKYLREITAPGVDTKFAEQHRSALAEMLGVSANAAGFAADLGLTVKQPMVRMRVSSSFGFPAGISEVSCRVDELATLDLQPDHVLIIENETTYLCAPIRQRGAVIWGSGFAVADSVRLPWLAGVAVDYWGDLDTHGFAILNRVRARLPQVRSMLMDEESLLEHRERWVNEPRPTHAELARLTAAETAVYRGLVEDQWGTAVRLEQERIDWAWAESRLAR